MPHRKLDRHLGTRGWILLWCAAVWSIVGLGTFLDAATSSDPMLLHLYIPAIVRAVGWWVSASLAVYVAFRRRHVPVATGGLMIMPLIYVASYTWAWITWLVPGPPPGRENGWYSAVYFVLMVGIVAIASHVKEPTRDEVR